MSFRRFDTYVSTPAVYCIVLYMFLPLCELNYLRPFGCVRVLEEVPQLLPEPAVHGGSEVLQLLPLDGLPLLVLLHLDLVGADLDLRVVLDGAARLDQQLVDAPVAEVVARDDGAVLRVEVQAADAVGVQDVDEAGVVAVEEVLWDVVVGARDAVAITVVQDLLDRGGTDGLPQAGLGEFVEDVAQRLVALTANVDDHRLAALAARLQQRRRRRRLLLLLRGAGGGGAVGPRGRRALLGRRQGGDLGLLLLTHGGLVGRGAGQEELRRRRRSLSGDDDDVDDEGNEDEDESFKVLLIQA